MTIRSHARALAKKAPPSNPSPNARGRRARGPANHHSAAAAHTGSSASASLTSKASPSSTPAPARGHSRPLRAARATTAAPATASAAMTASIVSLRATITAEGATASASPPASAARTAQQGAQQPHQRRDERDPAERLGQQQRDAVEPEQSSRGHLQPQVDGRLVDRHAPARLERTAQERRPRGAHAAHRGVVVRVGRDAAERGEPQHGGQRQDRGLGPEAAPGAAH